MHLFVPFIYTINRAFIFPNPLNVSSFSSYMKASMMKLSIDLKRPTHRSVLGTLGTVSIWLISEVFFLTAGVNKSFWFSTYVYIYFPFLRGPGDYEAGYYWAVRVTSLLQVRTWVFHVSWWLSLGKDLEVGWVWWASPFPFTSLELSPSSLQQGSERHLPDFSASISAFHHNQSNFNNVIR